MQTSLKFPVHLQTWAWRDATLTERWRGSAGRCTPLHSSWNLSSSSPLRLLWTDEPQPEREHGGIIHSSLVIAPLLILDIMYGFKDYKIYMYSHFESYLGFGLTQVYEIDSGTTIHIVCPIQPIPCLSADALATLGARSSAGMVLTPKPEIFNLQHPKN